ncbi:GNAT family N-acetyltransferase [Amycolatopsis cihanbeyliensis]|uniref:RimJ/RimL family protein N-acetyltransferase n=1 Tax=Amycolatopsis cihanbeyliensis TaxID=1128664 RepID=A0A542DM06_AMYCI|nr:GNAT family N-acetyltransferase [Amycolatopsis cihanbeyliensis]TQJ04015.1 RimJ/RimL family protein N-acetyltransferase [Amycolatopsis cihanbeyliensis]
MLCGPRRIEREPATLGAGRHLLGHRARRPLISNLTGMPRLFSPAVPEGTLRGTAQPTIPAGELALRPWRAADAPEVRAAFDNPEIRHWHRRRFDSVAEAGEWIAGWSAQWAAETAASWAITGGALAGQVGLRNIDLASGCASLSYWVLPAARGRKVATRAVRALAEWCFGELGLRRLEIPHSAANEASCRVAGGLGYPLEGIMEGALPHEDGWHDMHLHARVTVPAST